MLQSGSEDVFSLIHAALRPLLLVLMVSDLGGDGSTALMLFLMLLQAQAFRKAIVVDSPLRVLLILLCMIHMLPYQVVLLYLAT